MKLICKGFIDRLNILQFLRFESCHARLIFCSKCDHINCFYMLKIRKDLECYIAHFEILKILLVQIKHYQTLIVNKILILNYSVLKSL